MGKIAHLAPLRLPGTHPYLTAGRHPSPNLVDPTLMDWASHPEGMKDPVVVRNQCVAAMRSFHRLAPNWSSRYHELVAKRQEMQVGQT